jgi:putative hydrolase of the HAD superfamily
MPPLKAIAFDLDDTLFPERDYAFSGFRAVAEWAQEQLGVEPDRTEQELQGYFDSGVRGDTFNRWLRAHGLPVEAWLAQMIHTYREHTPRLAPFPDVPATLQTLGEQYRLGLITQGHAPGQRRKLEALGLNGRFEQVIILGEDERPLWKPNPHPFRRWLEAMQLRGDESAYVGDNPVRDFLGSRRLGMWTVRIRRPGGQHALEEPASVEHGPDVELPDMRRLPEALQEVGA